MRTIITVLLIIYSSTLFSKVNTLGFFERKWSSHSTLEFYTDSTFAENYIHFSCGNYKSAMPDTNLRGSWRIDGDTLFLNYFPNNNESSFNLQKYLLYDHNNYLIPFGYADAPFLYYVKTKVFDSKGIEINPEQLIVDYESITSGKGDIKREEFRENLSQWFYFQNRNTTSELLLKDTDFFNDTQSPLIKEVFMMGQIKYALTNKKTKFNDYKVNLFGLYSLLEFCEQNPNIIEKEEGIQQLLFLKENKKLKKWLKARIKSHNKPKK